MFALSLPTASRRLPVISRLIARPAQVSVMRRERVSVSADLFRYRLELLEVATPDSTPVLKATLRTQIVTVAGRYRLILEGKTTSGRRRLFYDNAESPLASREAAGRRYRREMATAIPCLPARGAGPARRPRPGLPPKPVMYAEEAD